MNKLFLILVVTILLSVSGCTGLKSQTSSSRAAVEVLTDYHVEDGFIVIKARSNGCTFFNSFEVKVANDAENSLQIVRTKPDQCRMKPRTVSLQYSIKHLGLDLNREIKVTNPVARDAQ